MKAALIAASLMALSGCCNWKPDPITAAARLAAYPETKEQGSQDQPTKKGNIR